MVLLIVLGVLLSRQFGWEYQEKPDPRPATPTQEGVYPVVRISDGDTLVVRDRGKDVRIRLHGVDTPETRQRFGLQATAFTLKTLSEGKVRIRPIDRDRYGRIVAEVYLLDGRNLSDEIIRQGYGWWYERYDRGNVERREYQAQARQQRLGLWADDHPTAPWDWRRKRR